MTSPPLDYTADLVEPSDAERSQWPDATNSYVSGLEGAYAALVADNARMVKRERELVKALERIEKCAFVSHGGHWNGGENPILIARQALSGANHAD